MQQQQQEEEEEAVVISFWAANSTLQVDHRHANRRKPSSLVQNAPVPPAVLLGSDTGACFRVVAISHQFHCT